MALFSKSKTKSATLALDIGTEAVKAVVFTMDKNQENGTVRGFGTATQGLEDMEGAIVTDIDGVTKNSEEAILNALEGTDYEVTQAVIGIAGELVKGHTTTVEYLRPKPNTAITEKEIIKATEALQIEALDSARKKVSWESGLAEQKTQVQLVDAAIADVIVDGQRVTNPLKFKGRDLRISVYNSYAPTVHLEALSAIAGQLGLDLLCIAAEPYAVARGMSADRLVDMDAIFIDIGGGTTDVAVVKGGVLMGTFMFAIGGRSFSRRLAGELDIDFSKAEAVKLAYANGKLSADRAAVVKRMLADDVRIWTTGLALALEEFDMLDVLPGRIFLAGGGTQLPDISEALQTVTWRGDLPFAKIPKVSFMAPSDIDRFTDNTDKLHSPAHVTPLALANLALDVAGPESTFNTIVKNTLTFFEH